MRMARDFFVSRAKSFNSAVQGIITVAVTQPNMLIIAVAAITTIAAGLLLDLTRIEWAFVGAAIGIVWMAETFNTALEFLVDLVSPEFHPLAKKAKDAAAGAVLVAIILSLGLGGLILLPKLIVFFAE